MRTNRTPKESRNTMRAELLGEWCCLPSRETGGYNSAYCRFDQLGDVLEGLKSNEH
jgi:hypothetical protein